MILTLPPFLVARRAASAEDVGNGAGDGNLMRR